MKVLTMTEWKSLDSMSKMVDENGQRLCLDYTDGSAKLVPVKIKHEITYKKVHWFYEATAYGEHVCNVQKDNDGKWRANKGGRIFTGRTRQDAVEQVIEFFNEATE